MRSLEYDAPGKHVRWRSFCGKHDREAMRPYLVKLIGACMPLGIGPTHKRRVIEPLRKLGKLPVLVSRRRSV